MPGVTREQIAKAREIDLLDYLLRNEPSSVQREGANYRHKEHDSLVYSGAKKYWYWNSRGKSINALDYLMEIRGYSLVDAVHRLIGADTPHLAPSSSKKSPAHKRAEAERKPFSLPKARPCSLALIPYLQKRGIANEVIKRCIQTGILFEARCNRKPICVFVGRDDAGIARFGSIRSIGGDLRKDIAGSDKRFSFCYPPEKPGSRQLAVFEAPIDALSHASLQQRDGWQWNGYRLALCGTSPVALFAFLERHPEINRVVLHMDNDRAGIVNARKIKATMRQDERYRHIQVSVNPPRCGKDYNDKLLHHIEQSTKQLSPILTALAAAKEQAQTAASHKPRKGKDTERN